MTDPTGRQRELPTAAPAIAGDTGDLRRRLGESAAAVRRYLFGLCGSWPLAEDLAQEALLKAWRARDRFAGRASVRTWLFTIARNHWRDQLRRKKTAPEIDAIDPQPAITDPRAQRPDAPARRAELAAAVRAAVAELPAEQREVLALREARELTFAEIAEVLNVPVSTVKSRARYALGKLAETLGDYRTELDA